MNLPSQPDSWTNWAAHRSVRGESTDVIVAGKYQQSFTPDFYPINKVPKRITHKKPSAGGRGHLINGALTCLLSLLYGQPVVATGSFMGLRVTGLDWAYGSEESFGCSLGCLMASCQQLTTSHRY
ncbi:hypothetical protein CEXT_764791 [Caerostris extrusa]|uniref:Uncharacterized protein n=1 Tax=Caerostris extrusa TaxID=172846 RepID=A0AAV4NZN7_CAEEX|nr:hypothetical protein CEXT_764791 [Caerostris extrusa]